MLANILQRHKWLDCLICGKIKVIKKGCSFVRVMKRLGWLRSGEWWQCPDCQQKISIDDYLSKKQRLRELQVGVEYYKIYKELSSLNPTLGFLEKLRRRHSFGISY